MSYEAALVKDANLIKIYCHIDGYMDSNLAPIPIEVEIVEISPSTYTNIYVTNFLEYNKITLSNKVQQFTIPDDILAFKIPENYETLKETLDFAFKAFLPPRVEKVEFIKRESGQEEQLLYTKYFSIYDEHNVLIEPDKTYAKWFIYSIAQKLVLTDEEVTEETYCFEYDLHRVDTQAHAKDMCVLPMQIEKRSLAKRDSIYYSLYDYEITENEAARAQVVNGNLITNGYRLFYLGNNIYDGTDEITTVVEWAQNKKNV